MEPDQNGMVEVGPWVDEQLGPCSQLLLARVALELEELEAPELRAYAMAVWRGWLTERQVVRETLLEMGVDLSVELPEGFSPLEVRWCEEDEEESEDAIDDGAL